MKLKVELALQRVVHRLDELADRLQQVLVRAWVRLRYDGRSNRTPGAASHRSNSAETYPLLLRLQTETACRRRGALALRPIDLDPDLCLILLGEKGETVRWQPVSPTLMRYLLRHAEPSAGLC
ncbi:hypothetical protein RMN56_30165 [Micromonospora halotolerans]|uniref:Transcriptional regulator n=1 Tax=Micromonospora halotolerans TaxID=709879 RepID=A0ABZ0A6X2_9ACTN|nr:hypothetical protein [Micromonospora halotolerans]WNM43192.1 hypothetical protein RMN56_30165 [Micromonospora halotolerans]